MHVVSHAAELAGGLGVVLIGTWLATTGFGIALGRRLGAAPRGTSENALKSFLRGLAGSALLGANGTLPGGAAALARRSGERPGRTTLTVIGASFGPATMALLALVCNLGWGPGSLALAVLAVAAGAHALRTRWTPWGEAAAGLALVLIGLGLLRAGWEGLTPWLRMPTPDQKPLLVPVCIVVGATIGLALRSPGAAAALFVQGTATHALDGMTAGACLIGVLVSASWGPLTSLRVGGSEERSVAAVHALFVLLSAGAAGLFFSWVWRMPELFLRAPGGPPAALALYLFASLLTATLLVVLAQHPLHMLFVARLAPRLKGSALVRDLSAGCSSIPALALGGLGGAVDAAATAARDLVHKELSGAGTTELRRQQARAAAARAVEEIEAFRVGLEGVRWPGEAIEAVLAAQRSARIWMRTIDVVDELAGARMPSGDEALKLRFVRLRFGAMYRVEGVDEEGAEVSAQDLAAEREVFERELVALRESVVAACVAGTVLAENLGALGRHLDLLSELVRTSLEAVEARERVEHASFRFLPELPHDVELIEEPDWDEGADEHLAEALDELEQLDETLEPAPLAR